MTTRGSMRGWVALSLYTACERFTAPNLTLRPPWGGGTFRKSLLLLALPPSALGRLSPAPLPVGKFLVSVPLRTSVHGSPCCLHRCGRLDRGQSDRCPAARGALTGAGDLLSTPRLHLERAWRRSLWHVRAPRRPHVLGGEAGGTRPASRAPALCSARRG